MNQCKSKRFQRALVSHAKALSTLAVLHAAAACSLDAPQGASGGVSAAHGFGVVNTDYQSTSISIVSFEGEILSKRFITSASAEIGLSAALSGDVTLPSSSFDGEEIVLIDRTPAGVLSWVNRRTAEVRVQLNVSTGFFANPHDYVQVSRYKAYVPRFEPNLAAGQEAFDAGNDVLIIDPSVPEITGRIDLMSSLGDAPDGFYPRADRALMAGGKLRVLALGFNQDFTERLASRVVSIDPERDSVEHVLVIDGMHSCSDLALAPSGRRLALACNGAFDQEPEGGFPESGIVLLDVDDELEEVERFSAAELGGEMIGSVSYVSETLLLFTSYGRYRSGTSELSAPDRAQLLDLMAGEPLAEPLRESRKLAFSLGGLSCEPEARVCLLADAETEGGVVHHYRFDDTGRLQEERSLRIDPSLGLPPRAIGRF